MDDHLEMTQNVYVADAALHCGYGGQVQEGAVGAERAQSAGGRGPEHVGAPARRGPRPRHEVSRL